MDETEEQRVRQWIRNWHGAAPTLEHVRRETIRNADTVAAIEQLSDAFESARRHYAPPPTSGAVEQQRLFAGLRPQHRSDKATETVSPCGSITRIVWRQHSS